MYDDDAYHWKAARALPGLSCLPAYPGLGKCPRPWMARTSFPSGWPVRLSHGQSDTTLSTSVVARQPEPTLPYLRHDDTGGDQQIHDTQLYVTIRMTDSFCGACVIPMMTAWSKLMSLGHEKRGAVRKPTASSRAPNIAFADRRLPSGLPSHLEKSIPNSYYLRPGGYGNIIHPTLGILKNIPLPHQIIVLNHSFVFTNPK